MHSTVCRHHTDTTTRVCTLDSCLIVVITAAVTASAAAAAATTAAIATATATDVASVAFDGAGLPLAGRALYDTGSNTVQCVLSVLTDTVVAVVRLPLELGLHQPLLAFGVVARPQQRCRWVVVRCARQTVATVNVLDRFFLQAQETGDVSLV